MSDPTFPIEPRTTLDIMRDLLRFTEEYEWSGRENTACHCHPEYTSACPECHVIEGEHGKDRYRTHSPDCRLHALIKETDAFIRVEESLQEEAA
jgi:hypothetical protein